MKERDVSGLIDTSVRSLGDDVAVIRVSGEVDGFTASSMDLAISEAFDLDPRRLLVDLDDVTFFGTGGIAVLVQAHRRAVHDRVMLGLVCSSRLVLRPLDISGLLDLFTVSTSIDTALGISP